jgi:DNA-binding transcriptional LysR family regulator
VPTILSFVGNGLGVALLPAGCRRAGDRSAALVDIDDTSEHLDLPLYLASRKRERDGAVRRVVQATHAFAAARHH